MPRSQERNTFVYGGGAFVLGYTGAIVSGRGLEAILQTIARFSDVGLFILGKVNSVVYLRMIQQIIEQLGIIDRVVFHESVSASDMWKYIGAMDVSMITIEPVAKSYYYSLPNKFFESIQAEVPIIASRLPELQKLIEKYEIGLLCKNNDIEDICKKINEIRYDKDKYASLKNNLRKAKVDLCWEREAIVLRDIYRKYL